MRIGEEGALAHQHTDGDVLVAENEALELRYVDRLISRAHIVTKRILRRRKTRDEESAA